MNSVTIKPFLITKYDGETISHFQPSARYKASPDTAFGPVNKFSVMDYELSRGLLV